MGIGIKRRKHHGRWFVGWVNEVLSVLPNTKNQKLIIIVKVLGRWGREWICGGESNYHFTEVEFQTKMMLWEM